MAKKKDFPLRLCGHCAEEYASGGFIVEFQQPKEMIVGHRCDFCALLIPVYRARIAGKKRKT